MKDAVSRKMAPGEYWEEGFEQWGGTVSVSGLYLSIKKKKWGKRRGEKKDN